MWRAAALCAAVAVAPAHAQLPGGPERDALAASMARWARFHTFDMAIFQAQRAQDHRGAVTAAEDCIAALGGLHAIHRADNFVGFRCVLTLSEALRKGQGIERDEGRAFELMRMLVERDPEGDAAVALAEAYLDGSGTPQDKVAGGLIAWRVEHGEWTAYGPYGGLCKDCESLAVRTKLLSARIARELSAMEKRAVEMEIARRYPTLLARVTDQDRNAGIAGLAVLTLMIAGIMALAWRVTLRFRNPFGAGRLPPEAG